MAAVRHVGFLKKIAVFVTWPLLSCRFASSYKISLKSDNRLMSYDQKAIFKMAAAAILNCKNFNFGHMTVIGFNICCSVPSFIKIGRFLSRVSILMLDIDIANMSFCPSARPSVRYVPVKDENGLTYGQFFHHTVAQSF